MTQGVAEESVRGTMTGAPGAGASPTLPKTKPNAQTAYSSPARRRTLAGYAALGLALIACPCHLPVTLGVAAALVGTTAGTAAVAGLTENVPAVLALGAVVFVTALVAGFWLLQGRQAEPAPTAPSR